MERYLDATEIDDRCADVQYRLGRCCWAMQEYEKARTKYIRARELDTLRFRVDMRINEAAEEFRAALQIDPNSNKTRKALQAILKNAAD